jgi:hypothetical protein
MIKLVVDRDLPIDSPPDSPQDAIFMAFLGSFD